MKIGQEILNTFSNHPSFLSSKRIERFAVFALMLALTVWYIVHGILSCSISATDFIFIIGTWLGYAGFNTLQINKDKTKDQIQ